MSSEPTFLGRPLKEAIETNLTRSWFPRTLVEIRKDFGETDTVDITVAQMCRDLILESYTHPMRKTLVYQIRGYPRH